MNDWFTIDQIDTNTYIISEYRHWEETHCYLLNGSEYSLLIDTGLGICNIYDEVVKLTNKPVIAVATHIHWDHIGGHKYFSEFYAHGEELHWLNGAFPLTMDTVQDMVVDRCDLPKGYDVKKYEFFQGQPAKVLKDGDLIDIGDLVYKDTLLAYYPSTDPEAYLKPLKKVAALSVKRVFPGHHTLNIQPEILSRMYHAFLELKEDKKLHHGSGTYEYGDWAVWL